MVDPLRGAGLACRAQGSGRDKRSRATARLPVAALDGTTACTAVSQLGDQGRQRGPGMCECGLHMPLNLHPNPQTLSMGEMSQVS